MITILACDHDDSDPTYNTVLSTTEAETETETVDLTQFRIKDQPSFISIYKSAAINGYTIKCFDKYDENTLILLYCNDKDRTFKIAKFYLNTATLDVISDIKLGNAKDGYQDYEVLSTDPYVIFDIYTYSVYVFKDDLKNYKEIKVPEYKVNDIYYSRINNCLYYMRLDNSAIEKCDVDNGLISTEYTPDMMFTNIQFNGISDNYSYFILEARSQRDAKDYTLFVNRSTGRIDYKVQGYNKVFEYNDQLIVVAGDDTSTTVIKRPPQLKTQVTKYTLSDSYYLMINDFSEKNGELISYSGSDSDKPGFDFFSFNVDTGNKDHVSYFNMDAYASASREDMVYPDISDTDGYFEEYNMYLFGICNAYGVKDLLLWNINDGKPDTRTISAVTEYDYEEYQADPEIYYSGLTEQAQQLENKYGLHIYMGDNANMNFQDYSVEANTDLATMGEALNTLKSTLAEYPDGFFNDLCGGSNPIRGLCIFLTGNMTATTAGSIDDPAGFAVETDSIQIIAININCLYSMEQNLFHEISHAIDKKIVRETDWGDTPLFDDDKWNSFNPAGFQYVNSYFDSNGQPYNLCGDVTNTASAEPYYLNNDIESVYFVDAYSKTFPTEDKARLMEYLMEDSYDEEFFHSSHIQQKLTYYFTAIRKAFNNPKWPEKTFWEKKLQQFTN